jgi:hypothetical protein
MRTGGRRQESHRLNGAGERIIASFAGCNLLDVPLIPESVAVLWHPRISPRRMGSTGARARIIPHPPVGARIRRVPPPAPVIVFHPTPPPFATSIPMPPRNGTQVLRDGEHTGATPGRVVRGPGWTGWR